MPKAKPADVDIRWRMVIGRSSGTSSPSCNHLQVGELGDELRDGIVELPLALFVEGHHGDGDDRFGHRGDAEDGVFPQRLTAFERLIAVAAEFHELAMAGDHHADSGIVTGIDFCLHRVVKTVQALGREADRRGGSLRKGNRCHDTLRAKFGDVADACEVRLDP